jgi:hypothetical protein
VVAAFFIIWLSTWGSLTVPFAIDGAHIGPTNRCVNSEAKPYFSVGIIVSTINDTLVFFAITYRILLHNSLTDKWSERWGGFLNGRGMAHVSKALLQTGQLYYL